MQLCNLLLACLAAGALAVPSRAVAVPQQETGALIGTIRDEFNAMTLPTANIEVAGVNVRTITDMDGNYRLDLPPGIYAIKVSFSGYGERTIRGIEVASGTTVTVDVALQLAGMAVHETVVVTAEFEPELVTAAAQLLERKRAGAITDNLAREDMKANADTDAAAAMRRVTGVSVVDNQYVYVRGLGERYSNSTLNGAVLPTTEPDKRVVPLDLFPTSLLKSVQVVKSYLPDLPAEFSGGLVKIETVTAPRLETWTVSTKQTFNSQTSFKKDGLTYPGSGSDWLGFDGGRRALPFAIPEDEKVVRGSAIIPGRGFTPEALQQFGLSFENIWEPRQTTYSVDQDYSGSYGNRLGKLGMALSLGYRSKARSWEENQTFFFIGEDEAGDEILGIQNDYDFRFSDVKTRLAALGNLSFQIAPRHRLSWANMWTHRSKNETRFFEGFNSDVRTDIRDTRLYWIQEDLLSSTLRGEHLFPRIGNSRFDWNLNYSRAKRDEPDLRETLYEFDPSRGDFVLADESQSGFRMFSNLEDEIYQGRAHWSLFLTQWDGLPAELKIGSEFMRRERDFRSRRFRFVPRRTRGLDLTQSPEVLFAPDNIGSHFEIKEETRNTDTYTAQQDVWAAFVMVDLPLASRLRLVGGARVSSSRQDVATFDNFSPVKRPIVAELDDTDVLPGLNLIYLLSADMNLRGSYSRTVNRPEFRELSPFEFTDVVGGRAVVGNPGLRRALIDNFDLRWEWFAGPDEVLAASFFYKDFADPIERVVQPTAQLRTSFVNAAGATNKGFEIEARKRLGRLWAINLNYSYVDSRIEIEARAGQVQTSLERPLVGQSPHVVNAQLVYSDPVAGFDARALYNYFGRRIIDVGSLGLPDIYEEGRGQLDIIVAKRWGVWGVQLVGTNLTNQAYLSTQGGQDQRIYRAGSDVALRLSYLPR